MQRTVQRGKAGWRKVEKGEMLYAFKTVKSKIRIKTNKQKKLKKNMPLRDPASGKAAADGLSALASAIHMKDQPGNAPS